MSVTRTVTSGSNVLVGFTGHVETDDYNYYGPDLIYFRILRGGTEIARTAVFSNDQDWLFTNNNVSIVVRDIPGGGSYNYKVQCWIPNTWAGTESLLMKQRYLTVTEIRP